MLKKRTLALLLSLTMLLSLLTPTALATEGQEPETTQEEVVKSNENERTDLNGATENGAAKDENQAPQQPTTGDEEQPTGQDEPKNEDETKGEDGRPGEEPKQPEQPGDEQPTEPEQGEEPETPEEPEETEFDAEAVYAQLMACETVEEMDAIAAELTEEQIAQFSDEQLAAIEEHYAELKGEEPAEEPEEDVVDNGILDFTDVAPFLEPVQGETTRNILMAAVMGVVGTYSDEEEKDNGIKLIKDATSNGDGSYTIRMEAYATGESVTTVVSEDVPTDIVLVLDQSGSMEACIVCGKTGNPSHTTYVYEKVYSVSTNNKYYCLFGGTYTEVKYCDGNHWLSWNRHTASWVPTSLDSSGTDHKDYVQKNGVITPKTSADGTGTQFYTRTRKTEDCTPRITALKDAATSFVNAVAEKAKGTNGKTVNHRVAVVGFASGANNLTQGFKNMEVSGDVTAVNNVINNLTADGGTLIDQGISTANSIFQANPIAAGTKRNRVMIVFTDGAPGLYGNWCSESVTTANNAIKNAQTAKKSTSDGGYGATVYTIGVFSGANASNPGTLPAYTEYTEGYLGGEYAPSDENQIKNSNRFMHLVSSNYPNASNITTTGSINPNLNGSSYYLSAGDSDSLNSIFQQISDKINTDTTSTTLDANSVIKDVVTPYFTMPSGADVKVYTQNFGENGFDGMDAERTDLEKTVDITGDTVSVTGFSFKDNWCGKRTDENGSVTYHGQKLIIEFTVWPKDGFLGGNNVPTNGESSGIYENKDAKDPVGTFPEPKVNVPVKDVTVTINAASKNIYYGNDLPTDEQLRLGATATAKAGENETIDLWGNLGEMGKFVTPTTVVSKSEGFDGTADGKYTITVTLTPQPAEEESKGNEAQATSGYATADIYVFKPVITWQDSAIELGETADYKDNFVEVKWKHGTDEAKSEMGPAPTLVYEYDKAAAAFTQDTPVKVTVKLGTLDITSAVTFVHGKCTFKDCNFDAAKGQFIVHIKPFDLTITKAGRDPIDENQAFVFHVKSEDANVDMYVTIRFGSDSTTRNSVTIKDLKPGSYTVTEKTGWSWRYEVTDGASKTIKPENVGKTTPGQASVSFANSRTKNIYWLNGCSWAVNNWNSSTPTKAPATPGSAN